MKGDSVVQMADPVSSPLPAQPKRQGVFARVLVGSIAVSLAAMLWVSACSPSKPEQTQAAPSAAAVIDGATLLGTRCDKCHTLDRVKAAKKTRDQWEQTVTRMIGKGAQLTDAEKAALVDYLAKIYGP